MKVRHYFTTESVKINMMLNLCLLVVESYTIVIIWTWKVNVLTFFIQARSLWWIWIFLYHTIRFYSLAAVWRGCWKILKCVCPLDNKFYTQPILPTLKHGLKYPPQKTCNLQKGYIKGFGVRVEMWCAVRGAGMKFFLASPGLFFSLQQF